MGGVCFPDEENFDFHAKNAIFGSLSAFFLTLHQEF
jgi:hypothetical protein